MRGRSALVLLGLLAGLFLTGVGTAPPASAHALLVSTDPGEGARLQTAPEQVTLQFSEGVSLSAGYARVLMAGTERADTGAATVDGDTITIPLRSDLPEGGYLVSFRVVSADSHPVSGAFSFVVGDGELVDGTLLTGAASGDPVVLAALPVLRWIGFGGLALALGVPVFALVCWPAGWGSARMRRPAVGGTVAVAVAAGLTVLLQGPYAAGSGVGTVFDPALLGATVSSSTGWVSFIRLLLAVELIAVLLPAWRRGSAPSRPALVAAGLLAVGMVVSTAAVGHPVAGSLPVLAVAVTSVHVGAMCVWLGGLAALVAGVLRPGIPPRELAAAMPRFSQIAFGSVLALVVSGVVQGLREVGTASALFTTTYGWLLVAKVLVLLVVLGAAGVSRVWVQQRLPARRHRQSVGRRVAAHAFAGGTGGAAPAEEVPEEEVAAADVRASRQAETAVEELPTLRRSVLVEVVLGVVVLALSAVLVGTPPARAVVAEPVDATLALESTVGAAGSVQVSIDPARPGANTLHLYLFDDAGRLTQPAGIEVALSEAGQGIGPLKVELEPAGPGHYLGNGMTIPGAGTWTLTVTVRLDEFTAATAQTTFPAR